MAEPIETQSPLATVPLGHTARPIDFTGATLGALMRHAFGDRYLHGFGAPDPVVVDRLGPAASALATLHLAAAYHRLAVVCDVVADYRDLAGQPENVPVYAAALSECLGGMAPYYIAKTLYQRAVSDAPSFAEAHFGLARAAMAAGEEATALMHFGRVVDLPAHPDGPAHAHLHANAYWYQANLLEDLGNDAKALECYRNALAKLGNFGVHHLRVAKFFRRLGLGQEAAENFQRCMEYSHRYFAEFSLPPLTPPVKCAPCEPASLDPIYTTSLDETVVFWQGRYFAIPRHQWPLDTRQIQQLGQDPGAAIKPTRIYRFWSSVAGRWFGQSRARSEPEIRVADSIAEFEPMKPHGPGTKS